MLSAEFTFEIAKYLAELEGVYEVIGGGDSISALKKSGQINKIRSQRL